MDKNENETPALMPLINSLKQEISVQATMLSLIKAKLNTLLYKNDSNIGSEVKKEDEPNCVVDELINVANSSEVVSSMIADCLSHLGKIV